MSPGTKADSKFWQSNWIASFSGRAAGAQLLTITRELDGQGNAWVEATRTRSLEGCATRSAGILPAGSGGIRAASSGGSVAAASAPFSIADTTSLR
jgi:hypothetical protein